MTLIGDIVTTAISPFGMLAVLFGFVFSLGAPVLGSAVGLKAFANFNIWLGLWMIRRPAIVITEHGEPLLKKMTFDSLGVEKISFGDEVKEFSDPNAALHSLFGFPFALASEPDGLLFDPRHAVIGQLKHAAQQRGEWTVTPTTEEWTEFEVDDWMRGTFALPRAKHVLPDLTNVSRLKFGGERAEYSQRVEKIYEKMLAELQGDRGNTVQYMMIVVALVAPFAACWLIASQGGQEVAGGSTLTGLGGTLVAIGLLGSVSQSPPDESTGSSDGDDDGSGRSRSKIVAAVAGLCLPVGIVILLGAALGVGATIAIVALFVIGLLIVPAFAFFVRLVGVGSEGMGRKFVGFGLSGYADPVFEWTPESYEIREAADLDIDDEMTTWYSLLGSRVGFSFEPGERSWGAEVVTRDDIDSYRDDTLADGGSRGDSDIPATHAPAPDLSRGRVGAFLPKNTGKNEIYLNSGIVLQRFEDSAMGQKALNRLLWAKENHDGKAISEKSLIYLTVGCGVLSFVAGVGVFFL